MSKKNLNIPIDEYTSPVDFCATESMKVSEVNEMMTKGGFRHVPVVRDQVPVGIISDRDLGLVMSLENAGDLLAQDIMVKDPFYVYTGTSIDSVAYEMANKKIGSALVLTKEGKLDGIFTSIDGLNALIEIVRGDIASK